MSAPNLKEIEWAIHELEQEESSEKRYSLLAALYTCRNEMLGGPTFTPQTAAQLDPEPSAQFFGRYGDSKFLQSIEGKSMATVCKIMDELMETLLVINRRAYDRILQKINEL